MTRIRRLGLAISMASTLLLMGAPPILADPVSDFDHLSTAFPLTGSHERVECEACHLRGVLKGTPLRCAECHGGGVGRQSTGMPSNHIPVTADCGDCHITTAWSIARFDHSGISSNCIQCHNGSSAKGKSWFHLPSSDNCGSCHRTLSWTPAVFDHPISTGNCLSCHNGVFAEGKPGGHIPSPGQCETCHNVNTWAIPGGFDHSLVSTGCSGCHNGGFAPGKHVDHIPSPDTCETCHDVNSWIIPGGFDHSLVTSGCSGCHNGGFASGKHVNHIPSPDTCELCHNVNTWTIPGGFDHSATASNCSSCHNDVFAQGMPSGHFVTSIDCSECHGTQTWGTIRFVHRSPLYPGNHSGGVGCNDCHSGNTEQATWTAAHLKPDCAGCHLGDFKQGPHKKTEKPRTIYYSAADLRDCTSSCHFYTDDTFTRIEKNRSGEHRVNGGDW